MKGIEFFSGVARGGRSPLQEFRSRGQHPCTPPARKSKVTALWQSYVLLNASMFRAWSQSTLSLINSFSWDGAQMGGGVEPPSNHQLISKCRPLHSYMYERELHNILSTKFETPVWKGGHPENWPGYHCKLK